MKSRFISALALAVFFSPISFVAADEPDTELGKKMDKLDDHYKEIRRADDAATAAIAAREGQKLVAASFEEVPKMLTKMEDGPDKQKAMALYRQLMGESYAILCKIELAGLDGDLDKAKELYDELKAMRTAGHDKFVEDDE